MFKYTIVVEVSPDMSFKSMEELVEAIKLWRGVRNVELQNASQQTLALDLALPPAKDDVYKIEWLDGDTVRLPPSQ